MKLFFKPGACSLASHIILNELGLAYQLDMVDTDRQLTGEGLDYRDINAKGYVPALQLDDGEILTEGASILQYLAQLKPGEIFTPAAGSIANARLQEHLNYVASELHKAFGPFFRESDDAEKSRAEVKVALCMDHVEASIEDGRDYLLGDQFSVADAYLFVVSNWSSFVGIDLARWPRMQAFVARVASRPAVQKAMKAEGLI